MLWFVIFFTNCGDYCSNFAQFFVDSKETLHKSFEVELYRLRLDSLIYHYNNMNRFDGYESDYEGDSGVKQVGRMLTFSEDRDLHIVFSIFLLFPRIRIYMDRTM